MGTQEMDCAYKNKNETVARRVKDLLSRMTREEKVGQLLQLDGRIDLIHTIKTLQPGSFLHLMGDVAATAMDHAAQTRLGIPLLLGIDAIHGHSFWPGATIFPTQLAMACTWNKDMVRTMAQVTAAEMTTTGVHWTFSPVLCLTRDLRWGRVGETFGEDPLLITELGEAMIQGYQGDDLTSPSQVLSTAKHYAGYSETQGGRDASEADLSQRKLRSYFLPPFQRAAQLGSGAFMTGYQSIEGLPSTINPWLLKEVLRDEWGYQGVVVTDWDNVGALVKTQKVYPDYAHAAAAAVQSGNDLIMATPEFFQGALDAMDQGMLKESDIDPSVERILALKFRMGLFENPRYPDKKAIELKVGASSHREAALEAARQSAVLLRNTGILPLDQTRLSSIALIGPNADHPLSQLGDWSLGTGQANNGAQHPRSSIVTIRDGFQAAFGDKLRYSPGCEILSDSTTHLDEALALAKSSDVAVVVLGDQHELVGEFKSTATLELQGGQLRLIKALAELDVPLVVVLVNSKPLVLPPEVYKADGVIELFNPGMLGGTALVEILTGEVNPSGRLPISFPYHVGQQPIFYSQVRGQHGDRYADLTQEPLYAFGEGLSYTSFSYGPARLNKTQFARGEVVEVRCTIKNTGSRPGVEVAQLYLSDVVTSVTWVDRELIAWERVSLEPDEEQEIVLNVPVDRCSLVDSQGNRVVESGEFDLLIGPSSRRAVLQSLRFQLA